MLDTLSPCPWPAMGDFSPMTTAPSGPSISAKTQTICVYHFDKFVKHSGILGQEAVKERYLRYSLQTISTMCCWFSPLSQVQKQK